MRWFHWVSVVVVIACWLGIVFSTHACEQQTFILDGRVVVCSSCGGVTVCN